VRIGLTPRPAQGLAFAGLVVFTVVLYVRPNDLLPIGTFPVVKIIAIGTLIAFFLESILARTALVMPPLFRYLLGLSAFMILSIPFGLDAAASYAAVTDGFLKVILIFIVIINTVRSFARIRIVIEVMVLSGALVAVATLLGYLAGRNIVEGLRASGGVGGIFGNPNDLALAMNMLVPLAVGTYFLRTNAILRSLYAACAVLFVTIVVLTHSRAGFLTLIVVMSLLLVRLGPRHRTVWGAGAVIATTLMVASPGTFWSRILTLFAGSAGGDLSAAESATARWGLIRRSLEVAGTNPIRWLFGVGVENFHIVSDRELVNHNAYLQVFNEAGVVAFVCYVAFLVGAVRITARVRRQCERGRSHRRVWVSAVSLEACLVAYLVGSFFASVAFLWYVYYPAGFAVCLQQVVRKVRPAVAKSEAAPRVWYLRRVQH